MASPEECKPLVEREKFKSVEEGYRAVHVTLEQTTGTGIIVDYNVWPLATFRVLISTSGSILEEQVLWIEQLFLTVVFLFASAPPFFFFDRRLAEDRNGEEITIRRWLTGQEGPMRNFALIMSGLCVFLLSFYTSLCVARWWTIRTQGLGALKAAATELLMLVSQLVTDEEQVIDSIRRYTLASMLLCFLWRGHQLDQVEDVLVGRNILTRDEVKLLGTWNHNLHETIWAWHVGIITMLYKQGKIKSDQLFSALIDRCREGRSAMQLIHTHLAVKIPMQYVHLLGFLVKVHNFILAFIMGMLFGAASREREYIICLQLFGRTCLLPFLFNAILCINAALADPFDGGVSCFPRDTYVKALDRDCRGFIEASHDLPAWIQDKKSAPPDEDA